MQLIALKMLDYRTSTKRFRHNLFCITQRKTFKFLSFYLTIIFVLPFCRKCLSYPFYLSHTQSLIWRELIKNKRDFFCHGQKVFDCITDCTCIKGSTTTSFCYLQNSCSCVYKIRERGRFFSFHRTLRYLN